MSLILLVAPPKGYRHIFDARIEWGDLWFRPCDGTWVEVGAAMVGSLGSNPSAVCARKSGLIFKTSSPRLNFLKNKFDRLSPPCDTPSMTKLYNIGAYGIPAHFLWQVKNWSLDLTWSAHARSEAVNLVTNLSDLPPHAFGIRGFIGSGSRWEVVELEATNDSVTKIVVRRPVLGTRWSLVLVITSEGTIKTCWVNLTSDTHRTLDQSKYAKI